jgi:hypothetical protein
MRNEALDVRLTLLSAAIAGLGVMLCVVLFGSFLGGVTGTDLIVLAAAPALAVAAALILGGRQGLVVLWALLGVLWTIVLCVVLTDSAWVVVEAVWLLPARFASWSFLGFPLALATAFFLHRHRSRPGERNSATVLLVLALWAALMIACAALARHAPDVGTGPGHDPLIAWPLGILVLPGPGLLSWWSIRRLRGRGATALGPFPENQR